MSRSYPRFKAAACHAAPVFLDSAKTADKACDLIAEASRNGAKLVVFPESFIPGFPLWAALQAPIHSHEFFATLAGEAVLLDGPEIEKVRMAARRHGVVVSLGITEGTDASVGCLWNSNVLIGMDGAVINHHRKLVPTFYEKLIWANGDGRGLRVVATEIGRLGMLICGENTNPLARFTLMAQGEQVHMSSYPPVWPTRPSTEAGGYDLRRAIEIRAGSHAFEAKVFNVVASGCLDASIRDKLAGLDKAALRNDGELAARRVDDHRSDRRGDQRGPGRPRRHRLCGDRHRALHRAEAVPRRRRLLQSLRYFPPRRRSHAAQSGCVHRGGDRPGADATVGGERPDRGSLAASQRRQSALGASIGLPAE